MEEIVGSCDGHRFDVEIALEQQIGLQSLPFTGMDKSGSAICTFYLRGQCGKSVTCPLRHTTGNQNTVCKHWLRGLCKKGDSCEFLHEYDMSKMPECYFYQRLGQCCNKECPFLHVDPESKIKDCAWYDRGFCRHGPSCKNRHVRRVMCPTYLFGFCPDGRACKFMHPRFELPTHTVEVGKDGGRKTFTCHQCGEAGHKAAWCLKKPMFSAPSTISTIGGGGPVSTAPVTYPTMGNNTMVRTDAPPPPVTQGAGTGNPNPHPYDPTNRRRQFPDNYVPGQRRPLNEVTCFKCGERGHYANRCPKGHLAFLHNPATMGPQQT